MKSSLARNAVVMAANSALLALTGFAFWVIAARRFGSTIVGTLTPITAFLAVVSIAAALGLAETVGRHLQHHLDQRALIRAALRAVSVATLAVALLWFFAPSPVPDAKALADSSFVSFLIILSAIAASSVGMVVDASFIAARRPSYLLVENAAAALVKLSCVLFMPVSTEGLALSVLAGACTSTVIGLLLIKRVLRPSLGSTQTNPIDAPMRRFAAGNALSALISILPPALAVALVASHDGPRAAAHVSIPLLVYSVLTVVPGVVARSLFAEASAHREMLRQLAKKSLALALVGTLLAAGSLYLVAPLVLQAFGAEYKEASTTMLRILCVAALVSVPNYVADVVLNVRRDVLGFVVATFLGTSTILIALVLAAPHGPTAVALAWVVGQLGYALASWSLVWLRSDKGR